MQPITPQDLGRCITEDPMNKKKIAFIAVTALFALATLPGAVMDLIQPQIAVDMMVKLGLPLHILTLVGIWKLLGIAALATPRYRRLNEWAYAGFFFDLTGAAFLHGAGGDYAGIAPPLVLVSLLAASYVLRNRARDAQPEQEVALSGAAAAAVS